MNSEEKTEKKMHIKLAAYAGSYPSESKCPEDDKPEYVFIGRSNVGKSSLINALTGRKNMARVSKSPGKTQMINFYLINGDWYLVDLPGYGYAKISKTKRQEWRRMVEGYLVKRQQLQCAFILIDSNISPQKIDIEFINWLGQARIPFVLVFTKVEKSKPEQVTANVEAFKNQLLEEWTELPADFMTSALSGQGSQEILSFIKGLNQQYYE